MKYFYNIKKRNILVIERSRNKLRFSVLKSFDIYRAPHSLRESLFIFT